MRHRTRASARPASIPPLSDGTPSMKPYVLAALAFELAFGVFLATAAPAQDPGSTTKASPRQQRSVKILTDVPEAAVPAPDTSDSSARLELLNSKMKIDNAAGLSLDLIP